MKIYDNGWYRIIGIKSRSAGSHYFFNDLPIHLLNHGNFVTDYSKRYADNKRCCKKCLEILKAYSTIGLENRLT